MVPGLEKLINANRSVSSVNDRLFPVELTEIADWKSMSEYTLHSNFGKALTRVIGGNFGATRAVRKSDYTPRLSGVAKVRKEASFRERKVSFVKGRFWLRKEDFFLLFNAHLKLTEHILIK